MGHLPILSLIARGASFFQRMDCLNSMAVTYCNTIDSATRLPTLLLFLCLVYNRYESRGLPSCYSTFAFTLDAVFFGCLSPGDWFRSHLSCITVIVQIGEHVFSYPLFTRSGICRHAKSNVSRLTLPRYHVAFDPGGLAIDGLGNDHN